jgi:hypothetical protein
MVREHGEDRAGHLRSIHPRILGEMVPNGRQKCCRVPRLVRLTGGVSALVVDAADEQRQLGSELSHPLERKPVT